jgi:endoribonuclease GhoS-like protein
MGDYLTRVELLDTIWPDEYVNRLHPAMSREGFSKTITDEKGIVYELPIAEYYKRTSEDVEQVIERAKKAAMTIGKKFGIIVGDCTNLKWSGLAIAKQ